MNTLLAQNDRDNGTTQARCDYSHSASPTRVKRIALAALTRAYYHVYQVDNHNSRELLSHLNTKQLLAYSDWLQGA